MNTIPCQSPANDIQYRLFTALEFSMLYPALGLMGGTFDPIHFGHLRMALECQVIFHLYKVKFIPCYQPMHKALPIADAESRLRMVKLAIADEPVFECDDCEIRRATPSYTIDTLRELRALHPQTSLCLLLGIDAFLGLQEWREQEALLDYCHIIVAHRPAYQLPTSGFVHELLQNHRQADPSFLRRALHGGIFLHHITALDVSATNIRQQIARQADPRYLLPDTALQYIHQHHLYQEKNY